MTGSGLLKLFAIGFVEVWNHFHTINWPLQTSVQVLFTGYVCDLWCVSLQCLNTHINWSFYAHYYIQLSKCKYNIIISTCPLKLIITDCFVAIYWTPKQKHSRQLHSANKAVSINIIHICNRTIYYDIMQQVCMVPGPSDKLFFSDKALFSTVIFVDFSYYKVIPMV